MRLRQLSRLTSLLDGEPSGPIATLQILESVNRDTRSTRGKLQQSRFLFSIPTPDAFPEVCDDLVVLSVAAVISVLLPVVNIDVCYATDEELEFTFVKDVDKIRGDELVEALHKGIKLLIDTLLNAPFCDKPGNDVSDGDMTPS